MHRNHCPESVGVGRAGATLDWFLAFPLLIRTRGQDVGVFEIPALRFVPPIWQNINELRILAFFRIPDTGI